MQATVYYRENFNGFADVVRDLGGGVFLMTSENISKSRSVGLELVANGKISPTLSYSLSAHPLLGRGRAAAAGLAAGPLGLHALPAAAASTGRRRATTWSSCRDS